jgi:LmbE family N-acetylglucosaminyl deacetylase
MSEWAAPVEASVLERVVVVSPHLDDAVLGCGQLLAAHPGAVVVTVTARTPPAYPDPVNDWDAQGGFGPADDVMAARRAEDVAALAVLGATPAWLDFDQFAYRDGLQPHDPADVAPALEAALVAARPTAVFVPFGLGNPDHTMTHEAAMLVHASRSGDWSWFCYEDGGYKHIPGLLARRISQLFRARVWPTPAVVPVDPSLAAKRAALACYTSQLPPLDRDHRLAERLDAAIPEQHWCLSPPPPGWGERLAEA